MDKQFAILVGGMLLFLAIMGAGIVVKIHNYRECKAHGLSTVYCATALR